MPTSGASAGRRARMLELLEDHNFHAKGIEEVIILELFLVEDFDGRLALGLFGDCLVHGCLRARAQHLLHPVPLSNVRNGDITQ